MNKNKCCDLRAEARRAHHLLEVRKKKEFDAGIEPDPKGAQQGKCARTERAQQGECARKLRAPSRVSVRVRKRHSGASAREN